MSRSSVCSSLYELETLFLEKLQEKYKLNIRDIKRAFARFDVGHNGLLDVNELVKGFQLFLNGVKESKVRELVHKYDVNGDGKVSFEEFLHFLTSRSAIDPYDDVSAGNNDDNESLSSYPSARSASAGRARARGRPDVSPRPLYDDERSERDVVVPISEKQLKRVSQANAYAPSSAREEEDWVPRMSNRERARERETYSDVESDIVPPSIPASALDESNPKELENRAKAFLQNLRNYLIKKASDMRLSGRVKMPVSMTLPELHESVARGIISKAFQPYTGAGEGRARDREHGVEFPEFARVLRSFSFPGTAPLRSETIQFLFDICSATDEGAQVNEEGRPVAAASQLVDLVFGSPQRKSHMPRPQVNGWVGESTESTKSKVDPITGRPLKGFISTIDAGRNTTGRGPVRVPAAADAKQERLQELLAVPLRFISRKSRTSLAVPSNFDPNTAIPRSNSLPDYDLVRDHVFGMSTTRYSGNALHVVPRAADLFPAQSLSAEGRPVSSRTQPDFLDHSTVLYSSAALGVVHNLSANRQQFLSGHKDDISCVAVCPDGSMAATGCVGKNASVMIWSLIPTRSNNNRNRARTDVFEEGESDRQLIQEIGRGFFVRGVCAVEFSWDARLVVAISCDDNHMMGIFEISSAQKVFEIAAQHGIPPQIKWIAYCPASQHSEYVTREHAGLCDLFVTAGEHHLRLWSFRRANGTEKVSLEYKGLTVGKSPVSTPKCFTSTVFVRCADNTFDVAAAGSNGAVFLFRRGALVAHSQALRGAVQCLVTSNDRLFCGGAGGVVKELDSRTLAVLRAFALLGESPVAARPSSSARRASSAGPAGRRPSSAPTQAAVITAKKRLNEKPTHAAGMPTRSAKDSDALLAGGGAEAVDSEERGARTVTGLAVVLGAGRNAQGGLHLLVSLGTGKLVRVEVGASREKASESVLSRDLFYFHVGPVYGLAADVTSSQRLVATVGDDRLLMVWDAQDRVLLARAALKNPSRCVHIDKTNSFIAVGCNAGSVTVFFLSDTLQPNTKYHQLQEVAFRKDCKGECTAIKFSPDNSMLAVGSRDDCIYIYGCALSMSETGRGRDIHAVGQCALRAMHRLKGHSSSITHIDWSYDSRLLQSTCSAYELLCWEAETGRMNSSVNVADVRWQTQHCVLGFSVMGIWPPGSDGTDINSVDVCREKGVVATANDEHGLVRLLQFPCVVQHAPAKSYSGHSSHVTSFRFLRGGDRAATTGGNDGAVMLWNVVAEEREQDGFR